MDNDTSCINNQLQCNILDVYNIIRILEHTTLDELTYFLQIFHVSVKNTRWLKRQCITKLAKQFLAVVGASRKHNYFVLAYTVFLYMHTALHNLHQLITTDYCHFACFYVHVLIVIK